MAVYAMEHGKHVAVEVPAAMSIAECWKLGTTDFANGSANVNNYKPEPDGEFDPSGESNISKWPRDMRCYVDSEGNTYDFAYGLNWKGQINDRRVKKYYGNSPVPR